MKDYPVQFGGLSSEGKKLVSEKRGRSVLETVKPKTHNQENAVRLMETKPIAIVEGLAGTGKTYLAVHYALKQFLSGKVGRVIFTRPLMNVGNEQLGFLPGEVDDKTQPYSEQFNEYMEEFLPALSFSEGKKVQRGIEFIPLAHIRGRNFANAIIIADEMQNATSLQMKTLLTRLAEGSQVIVLGDTKQSDRGTKESGLAELVRLAKTINSPHIGHVVLGAEDVMRSDVIVDVMRMYGDI